MRIGPLELNLKRPAPRLQAAVTAAESASANIVVLNPKQHRNFFNHVLKTSGCWLWQGAKNAKGYGRCDINYGSRYAHRVAYLTNIGPIPCGLLVLHKCDVPACVNPEHLFIGTDADNAHDRDNKGRMVPSFGKNNGSIKHPENLCRGDKHPSRINPSYLMRGENHKRSKLNWDKVRSARVRYAAGGVTFKQLGEEYGVNSTVIGDAINGNTWRSE